jgi:hypothetical protein
VAPGGQWRRSQRRKVEPPAHRRILTGGDEPTRSGEGGGGVTDSTGWSLEMAVRRVRASGHGRVGVWQSGV